MFCMELKAVKALHGVRGYTYAYVTPSRYTNICNAGLDGRPVLIQNRYGGPGKISNLK